MDLGFLIGLAMLAAPLVPPGVPCPAVPPPGPVPVAVAPAPPSIPYYDFVLAGTTQVPGIGRADGTGSVAFEESPFGVAVAADGSYRYEVSVSLPTLRTPPSGVLTVWFTTPSLDRVERAGMLVDGALTADMAFNKFLVVVTLEPEDDRDAQMWSGPIVSRGMSKSGLMHTMAGHGPYDTENCAAYGYGP
jgi:hypothetical protein